ncbi:hypothetical protein HPB50_013968 [Hyalomma asiaticum]|uniref:Uncharacterized protein n=1 Tax=Hyalomma asiaticum TaxID=266040 RepID=A0ACB7T7U7_HYAAI|nr:hypothetical protein HPB50_013968 [Hyalomma asiaticum]
MKQKENQAFDEFVTELRRQAEKCDFGERKDRLIGDRIVVGIRDGALRERLFRERDLTLDKIITTCKRQRKFPRSTRVYKARHPALKSGAGAEDSENEDSAKAWVFYDQLLFLKDSIVGRPTSGNLEVLCEEGEVAERPRTDETAESIFEDMISESSTSPEPDTYQATRREPKLSETQEAI